MWLTLGSRGLLGGSSELGGDAYADRAHVARRMLAHDHPKLRNTRILSVSVFAVRIAIRFGRWNESRDCSYRRDSKLSSNKRTKAETHAVRFGFALLRLRGVLSSVCAAQLLRRKCSDVS